jgi:hypothetical protein
LFLAHQKFDRPVVADIPATVHEELGRVFLADAIKKGARIGVTVGSRGISNIATITLAAVDFLKSREANPFIIPAMGSHGGATAEGQTRLLAHYGVTEESMGCPVRAEMETETIGKTPKGMDVYVAKVALDSDGILLLNRIKPHTDYKGPIESGLTKISAIGLGKLDGATSYHSRIYDLGLGGAVRDAAEKIFGAGDIILGGLGIIENAYHETAKLTAMPAATLFKEEEKLLKEAFRLMGKLPFSECDVLLCDRIGKNISGTGMDTNIIGRNVRGFTQGKPWFDGMPAIHRIFVRSLTAETEGNAIGMGLAEFCTTRFVDSINYEYSQLNSFTACSPLGVQTPAALPNDRLGIQMAIRTCGYRDRGYTLCFIRDTLALENIYLSEHFLEEEETMALVEAQTDPEPLTFDAEGWLQSPFED